MKELRNIFVTLARKSEDTGINSSSNASPAKSGDEMNLTSSLSESERDSGFQSFQQNELALKKRKVFGKSRDQFASRDK